jgi:hypothetical protein
VKEIVMKKIQFIFLWGMAMIMCVPSFSEELPTAPTTENSEVDSGFDEFDLSPEKIEEILKNNPPHYDDPSRVKVFFQKILSRIAELPGVLDFYVWVLERIYGTKEFDPNDFHDLTPQQVQQVLKDQGLEDDSGYDPEVIVHSEEQDKKDL